LNLRCGVAVWPVSLFAQILKICGQRAAGFASALLFAGCTLHNLAFAHILACATDFGATHCLFVVHLLLGALRWEKGLGCEQ
jgi:hypothetical protein